MGVRSRGRVAPPTREVRRDQRKGTSLRDRQVTARTRALYAQHLDSFFNWCERLGHQIPASCLGFDDLLQVFAEDLWQAGDSRRTLAYTLSALSFRIPSLCKKMNGAWRLHKVWERSEPVVRAPPLTLVMVRAIAGQFIACSEPTAALSILLAYHCLLRTGECLGLVVGDIRPTAGTVHLMLRDTKVGQRLSITELVTVHDVFLARCCRAISRSRRPHWQRLANMNDYRFRRLWAQSLVALQIPLKFLPYGLRRGGATAWFNSCGSFDVVSDRGRWRNVTTTRVYVQNAMMDLSHDFDDHPALLRSGLLLHSLVGQLESSSRKGCKPTGSVLGGGTISRSVLTCPERPIVLNTGRERRGAPSRRRS